jgi:hypothetical protein
MVHGMFCNIDPPLYSSYESSILHWHSCHVLIALNSNLTGACTCIATSRSCCHVLTSCCVVTLSTEQWKELCAGEPGWQRPAAPWDRCRYQATADPAAGPRGPWGRQEVWRERCVTFIEIDPLRRGVRARANPVVARNTNDGSNTVSTRQGERAYFLSVRLLPVPW